MEIKNNVMSKLNAYVKAVRVIWYIILGIGILMIISVLILMCLHLFGKLSLPSEHFGLEFSAPGLKMNVNSILLEKFLNPTLISMGVNIFAIWVLLLYSVYHLSKIFKSLIEIGTPFINKNVKRMRLISYSFFLYSVITFIAGAILKLLFIQDISIAGLSSIKLQISTVLPFWTIVCGVFILGIAEIFNYGLKLQQDNDSIVRGEYNGDYN